MRSMACGTCKLHLPNSDPLLRWLTFTSTLEDQTTKGRWRDWAHIFINGTGILNNWAWPEIEGLHDFKGPLIHSANWDHSVELDNKVVGVIGTGSTSVQIVPQLQKICNQVQVYMRSPTWISPPFGAGTLTKDLLKGKWREKPI